MLGIDIYRYQTVTDPLAVARAGVKYAWVKATDGFGPAIVKADGQVAQMNRAGIPVGLYHYAQLGDPRRQADIFIGEVRRLGAWGVMPALDLEDPHQPGAAARDFSISFIRRMLELGVPRPVLYANTSMLQSIRPDTWGIPQLVVWAADYGANSGVRNPDLRPYVGPVDVHQYTSVGRINGIAGQVDLNWALTTRHLNTTVQGDDMLRDEDLKFWNEEKKAYDLRKADGVVADTNTFSREGRDAAREANQRLAALEAKVDALAGGGVDLDALAAKIAAQLSELQAKANADELAKRLEG